MIVNIGSGNSSGNTVNTPITSSGRTSIDGRSLNGSGSRWGAVLYRVAGASEGPNYTFSLDCDNNGAVGSIVAFSGVDTSGATPFDVAPLILSGKFTFGDLALGTYTVTESDSTVGTWAPSLPKSQIVALNQYASTVGVLFGNYCPVVPTPESHPKSFWTSATGKVLVSAADFTSLNALHLVNQNGSARDFNATLGDNQTALMNWLNQSWGANMANELSAELAVNQLNINHLFSDPGVVVDSPRSVAHEIVYTDSLIAANPIVTNSTTTTYNEMKRLLQLLQRISSGQPFASQQPCPYNTP